MYSGTESPKEEVGIDVPHLDSKGEIEKYLKEQKVGLFDKLADLFPLKFPRENKQKRSIIFWTIRYILQN